LQFLKQEYPAIAKRLLTS